MLGAVLGGTAEGAGRGLGQFSQSLMQVLGSQQHRKQMQRADEQEAYRRHRDQVDDRRHRENMELQAKTIEARTRSEDRHFAQTLREQGYDFEYDPQGVAPPEGSVGIERSPNVRFRVGDYNPDADPSIMRARAIAQARARPAGGANAGAPETPTFSYGGSKFDRTGAGYDAARAHGEQFETLPGQGPAMDPNRGQLLVQGALSRLRTEDGEIDYFKLEDVLDELRRRPGVTNDDLEYVRSFFQQEF